MIHLTVKIFKHYDSKLSASTFLVTVAVNMKNISLQHFYEPKQWLVPHRQYINVWNTYIMCLG